MEINTPDWVKHAVFYQIFPDRFARSQQPCRGRWQTTKLEAWDSPPTYEGYKGGDLWGVLEKLDYLQDLGINAIYLNPIFQSASNHRYHTHDYYQVDPMLGGNRAFDELLAAAHQRGIKVILDGVFNHASRGFFFFNDILENGPHSPWLDWFQIEDWPLSAYDGSKPANYVSWVNNRALPQFNHANPQAREYLMQVGEYWIERGIDGWRLDVPLEVKHPGFWEEFRTRIKALNPEAYIVGEIWEDSSLWLDGTKFDAVMNYLFTAATIAFTAGDRVIREHVEAPAYSPYPAQSAQEYSQEMQKLLALYPWPIQLVQLNLLASHDTARLLTIAGGDRASVELATLLLMTFPGAPSIYYGDEVGLPGAFDPDCRRGFPRQADWDLKFLHIHKRLIALRHQYRALRIGTYRSLYADEAVYVFARTLDRETALVAVNVGMSGATVRLAADLPTRPEQVLYGNAQVSRHDTQLEIKLPPRSGCVIG
ncbi:MAG: glycoside hydrolase family 13 protein [Cyanophyceae cyanobacterium]